MSVIHAIKRFANSFVNPPSVQSINPRLVQSFNPRNCLRCYIAGNGIEIGALHMPLDLSGLPVSNIKYVDYLSEDDLGRRYPELGNVKLVHVDIVDNGELLKEVKNESLDFIIGNHFIEHTRDPIGTISNWLSKLKPGGVIFMAVPDKRYTFDVERELTSLQHLISDHHLSPEERLVPDRQHFAEWATFVDKLSPKEIEPRVDFLIEIDYSIHFHTFTLQSFLEMVNYLSQEYNVPLALKACADVFEGSSEFLVVLTRT